jgi:hypothetical protein
MSQELNLSKEEATALDRIEAELTGSVAQGAKAAALDIGELCKKYKAIRPRWKSS